MHHFSNIHATLMQRCMDVANMGAILQFWGMIERIENRED